MKVVDFSLDLCHILPFNWVWLDVLNWYNLSLQMIMSDFDWIFILYQILCSKLYTYMLSHRVFQTTLWVYFILVGCRIAILQIRKLNFNFAQGHTASQWWDSNQGLCDPRASAPTPISHLHYRNHPQENQNPGWLWQVPGITVANLSLNSAWGHWMYQIRGHAEIPPWTWRGPLEWTDPWGIKIKIPLLCLCASVYGCSSNDVPAKVQLIPFFFVCLFKIL